MDGELGKSLYQRFGTTAGGSKRYRCRACKTVFSVPRSTARQRRQEVNIRLFKLLQMRVSLTKIANYLEISPPTLYDKIDFLQKQVVRFQGDRERELRNRSFELLLSTDRQAYLCNWNRAKDARNVQLTGVATADTSSGYVLAMHVAYDPEPMPAIVEAEAISAGDYDVGSAYRMHARLWLEGDYAVTAKRSAEKRESTRAKRRAKMDEVQIEPSDDDDPAEDGLSWARKLPDRGMLVHDDYTMHAHFQFLRQLIGGAERLCFYAEKEPGLRSAIMAAFYDFAAEERLEAFHLMITKGLTINQKKTRLGMNKAAFRRWLELRTADGTITTQSWDECRLIRLLEAIDSPDLKWDGRSNKMEAWIVHPFGNMAEPDRRVLHITAPAPPDAPPSVPAPRLRPRPQSDRMWIARLVDKASLHAVDRYFMQIRREIAGLERGIAVASNRRRIWYGYTPYDPSMIPKLLDIHRAYYNWIQVSPIDGLTRAQRFGLAKGKIRHQDIIYHQ